jgi:hypothetical protein
MQGKQRSLDKVAGTCCNTSGVRAASTNSLHES